MAAITRLFKPSSALKSTRYLSTRTLSSPIYSSHRSEAKARNVQWVFLGCPGVGKGTYASRLSTLLGVPHIATGDLVRHELTSNTPLSKQKNNKVIYQMSTIRGLHSLRNIKQIHAQLVTNPNVYFLNILIKSSNPRDSILFFANWLSKNILEFDDYTFIFTLGACARSSHSQSALWEGKQVHARAIKSGFLTNVMIGTTCIHFYSINRSVSDARRLFDEMSIRNVVTWNAMIKGYCYQNVRNGENARSAFSLFKSLLVDVHVTRPTDTTMLCVLSAASRLGVLETGTCVHSFIEKMIDNPLNDVFIGTGLVDMYSKCGSLERATYVFERMKIKNVLTWTSMVTGLALHGKGKLALELLDDMKLSGIKPNEVTFTSLFSACCHSGLVEEGLSLFYSMRKFKVSPLIRHYGCVVDLLGRAGLLEKAYAFIKDMKIEPDVILWRSLLNACKVHGDIELGEKVGKILLEFPQENSTVEELCDNSQDYIALSNVYASVDRWENVDKVRDIMKMKGIQTKPGCSLISSCSH